MVWHLHDSDKAKQLESVFLSLGIDHRLPGFYDREEFLAVERVNARVLEAYAEYVEAREYSEGYLKDARNKIEVVYEALRSAVESDGRKGACVDISGMMGRMLDKLGIWNYVAKSCLTITYPESSGLSDIYFYGVDDGQFTAPHAIVVAPPFVVVDVTAKHQPFETPQQASYIPEKILLEQFEPAAWSNSDIAAPEIAAFAARIGLSLSELLAQYHGNMLEVAKKLPARKRAPLSHDEATLKYIIVAVGGMIEPLEDIKGYKPCGRTALEIFNKDVLPRL